MKGKDKIFAFDAFGIVQSATYCCSLKLILTQTSALKCLSEYLLQV